MAAIRHLISIEATPAKVYAALATAAGLGGWWTADTRADERVGGKAEFGFERRAAVYRMKVDALEPGKRVAWTCTGGHPEWKGTKLDWRIAAEDGATTLRFTHGGWKKASDFYASCNSTWGALMFRLKDAVEGKRPGPMWTE